MSKENTFNTHEDLKIQEIIKKAYSIKDREKRAIFVENECGGNEIMFESVIESLDDMFTPEKGASSSTFKSGDIVDNYKIIKEINQGGIASVYSAEHRILKTLAAIKVFDKLDVNNIENQLFWNTDHTSLARFNHDNIVKLHDVGEIEKNGKRLPYIVVEYVKGKHLDEHCESKNLSIRELLQLFLDLCEVMEFVHNNGKINHLDLKPDNILVTADRPHRIKLIDFGSSKLSRSESKQFTRSDLLNPVTLKFASPEQYDEDKVHDNQADIYSLGAILYLLITGKVPFGEGAKIKAEIKQEVTDVNILPVLPSKRVLELETQTRFGVPLKKFSQILSGDLDSIIIKALYKKRDDRYQSVSDFRRDIDNFLKGKAVKARKNDRFYKTTKPISRFLGFRGGLTGWEKWKSPGKRLSVAAMSLVLLVTAGVVYFIFAEFTIGRKGLQNPLEATEIDAFTQIGTNTRTTLLADNIINIFCGTRSQEDLCFTFMKIPKGSFLMGSNLQVPEIKPKQAAELKKSKAFDGSGDGPLTTYNNSHNVEITKDLYFAKFEVTNKQWNIVARKSSGKLEIKNDDNYLPKTDITYIEAVKFCEVLTTELRRYDPNVEIRLPSEAEWEYACRAQSTQPDTKDDENDMISASDREAVYAQAVNAIILSPKDPPGIKTILQNVNKPKPESALLPSTNGLVGMNGNVSEIVADAWHKEYDENFPTEAPWDNPASIGTYVLRGEAYNEEIFGTLCTYRKPQFYNDEGNGQIGFRIVMTGY